MSRLAWTLRIALACAAPHAWAEPEQRGAPGRPRTPETRRLAEFEEAQLLFTTALHAHERGDLETAAAAYVRAIQRDSGFVEALVNLARLRIEQGRTDEAESLLARAHARRPDYPPTYAALGWLAARRGQPGRARAELERAIALDPGSVEARINLAAVLIEHGSLDRASGLLERALELDPESAAAALNLGLLRDRLGDRARASAAYRLFLARSGRGDPQRAEILRRVAELDGLPAPEPPPAARDRSDPDGSSSVPGSRNHSIPSLE